LKINTPSCIIDNASLLTFKAVTIDESTSNIWTFAQPTVNPPSGCSNNIISNEVVDYDGNAFTGGARLTC